jgi:3-phosphoshikimate 1-carboxyvinyltransferase
MTRFVDPGRVSGRLAIPASKSSTQRAIACAFLACPEGGAGTVSETVASGAIAADEGASRLLGPGRSDDCLAALGVAAAFGAKVADHGDWISIRGIGGPSRGALGDGTSVREYHCGESGLALRMFSPIAALFPGESRLVASGSLRKRPVSMVETPLRALGADCWTDSGFPPVVVRGPLRGGRATVDGRESSQFLTGLLIALPLAAGDSILEVESLSSSGYVDLTIATMRAFGVELGAEAMGEGMRYRVPGLQSYRPRDFRVEGDWSGAAFPLVAAAIAGDAGGLGLSNLQADSLQPDRGILEALGAAGVPVSWEGDSLRVLPGRLRAFSFDARQRPDLFPPLAVLAGACPGESRIRGIGRLRAKESDRAASIAEALRALGVEVRLEGDEMALRGRDGAFTGGRVDAHGDHRIAMAAAVAALRASGQVEILGAECVAKSWPGFYADMESIVTR